MANSCPTHREKSQRVQRDGGYYIQIVSWKNIRQSDFQTMKCGGEFVGIIFLIPILV